MRGSTLPAHHRISVNYSAPSGTRIRLPQLMAAPLHDAQHLVGAEEPVGETRLERGEGSSCEAAPEGSRRGVLAVR